MNNQNTGVAAVVLGSITLASLLIILGSKTAAAEETTDRTQIAIDWGE